jgi:hypothetical protein
MDDLPAWKMYFKMAKPINANNTRPSVVIKFPSDRKMKEQGAMVVNFETKTFWLTN